MSSQTPFEHVPTYLFGHTPANEESLIAAAVSLYESGNASLIVMDGGGLYTPPTSSSGKVVAYSGGDDWRDQLVHRGVPEKNIVFMDSPRPTLSHTGTDAERFVRFAKSRDWKVVSVVAIPPQLLRAFAITVRCLERDYPELLVYSQPGNPLPWDQPSAMAQGVSCATLLGDGIDTEWDRINRVYGNAYDPVTAEQAIAYIKRRDEKARKMGL